MAIKAISILILFLLASSIDARRLRDIPSPYVVKDGLSPGEGNTMVSGFTLRGVKESGSSPGEGHKYAEAKPLGGVKDSGPSPGAGH
ncbi:hypothetical protein SASPL_138088 [Salvia splendens]|uniref:Uncharacterized protein n=1 Tax=Salvia splendens TaxID=180675 RepID=A0A8X8WW87_SALSN|nr:hypothetical protein SASPL_138088 [Salvia splendens]